VRWLHGRGPSAARHPMERNPTAEEQERHNVLVEGLPEANVGQRMGAVDCARGPTPSSVAPGVGS